MTQNTIVQRSGTNFTVDVTITQLDPDISIKDFTVLHNGTAVPNTPYTKTTATTLTYTGTALPLNTTIEIRRRTPTAMVNPVSYTERMSSALWNAEFMRKTRWQQEAELNGVGVSAVGSLPVPRNDPYPTGWEGDTVYPATRNALYNIIRLLAPRNNPTFTGSVSVPDTGVTENSSRAVNNRSLNDKLVLKADLTSPQFSGTPNIAAASATTPAEGDNSNRVATTQFVTTAITNAAPPVNVHGQFAVGQSATNNAALTVSGLLVEHDNGIGLESGSVVALPSNGVYTVTIETDVANNAVGILVVRLRTWNGSSWSIVRTVYEYNTTVQLNIPKLTNTLVYVANNTTDRRIGVEYFYSGSSNTTITTRISVVRNRVL